MKPITIGKGIVIGVLLLCAIALLGIAIYKLSALIAYFFIAISVALIGRPVVDFLKNKLRVPKVLAVVFYLLGVLGSIIGLITLLLPTIAEQGETLLDIRVMRSKLDHLHRKLIEMGTPSNVVEKVMDESEMKENIIDNVDTELVPDLMGTFFEVLANVSVALFSVLFISFFFLLQGKFIQRRLLTPLSTLYKKKAISALNESKDLLSRYLLGLLAQMGIIFIFYLSGLLLAGVENAVLVALLAALFNVIPYLGPLIGGGLMLFLVVSNNIELDFDTQLLPSVSYVLGGFLIGQLVDNLFSQPYIFSSSTKSHPLEIFTVIVASGLLFGLVGMIIAVPAYTIIRVVIKEFITDTPIADRLKSIDD